MIFLKLNKRKAFPSILKVQASSEKNHREVQFQLFDCLFYLYCKSPSRKNIQWPSVKALCQNFVSTSKAHVTGVHLKMCSFHSNSYQNLRSLHIFTLWQSDNFPSSRAEQKPSQQGSIRETLQKYFTKLSNQFLIPLHSLGMGSPWNICL